MTEPEPVAAAGAVPPRVGLEHVESAAASDDGSQPFDRDALLAVYHSLSATRIDYNIRKWDTLRAASVLGLGVLAAAGGIAASKDAQQHAAVDVIAGSTLIVVSVVLWVWLVRNVRRESELQFHEEFAMFQIERLLGLHDEIPARDRWLPGATRIFGRKHLDYLFHADGLNSSRAEDPEGAWAQARATGHRFLWTMSGFAAIFFVAALGFGAALIVLGATS